MDQIKGVDPSLTTNGSDPASTASLIVDIPGVQGDTSPFANLPEGTYFGYIHASNAQYYVARLLGNALSLVDASLPNKEQNKALKHLLRKEFDRAIIDIHQMAWPSLSDPPSQRTEQASCQPLAEGYILQPER